LGPLGERLDDVATDHVCPLETLSQVRDRSTAIDAVLQDDQVEAERLVLHVVQVVAQLDPRIVDAASIPRVHLRPPGQSRTYGSAEPLSLHPVTKM
jgi:hypothetical protein